MVTSIKKKKSSLTLNIYSLPLLTLTLLPPLLVLFPFCSSSSVGPEDKKDKFVMKSSVKRIATSVTERRKNVSKELLMVVKIDILFALEFSGNYFLNAYNCFKLLYHSLMERVITAQNAWSIKKPPGTSSRDVLSTGIRRLSLRPLNNYCHFHWPAKSVCVWEEGGEVGARSELN